MPLPTSPELQADVAELDTDIGLFHDIVQGDALTVVPTAAGDVPSVLKFYADITADIVSGILPGFTVETKTTTYAVSGSDANKVHVLSASAPFTLTVPAASGFPTKFTLKWYNISACGFVLAIDGITSFYIYPGQTIILEKVGTNTWGISPTTQRWRHPAGTNIYVNSAGNNANDGLASGASRAFATIQFAWDFIVNNCDVAGTQANILVETPLTLSNTVLAGQGLGKHIIGIVGDSTGAAPASFLLTVASGQTGFFITDLGWLANLVGVELAGTGGATLINLSQFALCDIQSCIFGSNTGGIYIRAGDSAKVNFVAPIPSTGVNNTFAGNVGTGIFANRGASVEFGGVNYSVSVIAISNAFLVASGAGAQISLDPGMAFVGAGAGSGSSGFRTLATLNGVISLGGLSATNIPGAAGDSPSTGLGGQIS